DSTGRTALHYAIAAGKLEAVTLLLPSMSNLDVVPTPDRDLLTMALETGDMKIFQSVLEKFPAILQWTPSTRHALQIALKSDLKEQVRLLLSKHPTPPTREVGTTPLIAYAIAKDAAVLFLTLLACGSVPTMVLRQNCE